MARGWYILNTYSGYEGKIERTIRAMLEAGDISSEIVLDVKVPVEDVLEVRNGKKRSVSRKFLPGYMMIEMDLPDVDWKSTCSAIRRIQGVTAFVGSTTPAIRPRPISNDEVIALLQKAGDIKGDKGARVKQSFSVGEQVKITDGPFVSFSGAIDEVNAEKGKLRVIVGIFGRATPVEVDLNQVEKI